MYIKILTDKFNKGYNLYLLGIKTAILVGGMAAQKQERVLNRKPEIVIATPGRLWELVKAKHPHLSNLRQLR